MNTFKGLILLQTSWWVIFLLLSVFSLETDIYKKFFFERLLVITNHYCFASLEVRSVFILND